MARNARTQLTNIIDVLDQLGGVHGVALLLRRSKQNICNWRARGLFPPVVYLKVKRALRARGFDVSPELFRIEDANADAA